MKNVFRIILTISLFLCLTPLFAQVYTSKIDAAIEIEVLDDIVGMPVVFDEQGFYKTRSSYPSGTEFRFHMTNDNPAYVYAFAADEATLSTMRIFPQSGVSPFINHVDSRFVWPSEHLWLKMDDTIGTTYLVVLFSKQALDINAIEQRFAREQGTLSERVNRAVGSNYVPHRNINFNANIMEFSAEHPNPLAVYGLLLAIGHHSSDGTGRPNPDKTVIPMMSSSKAFPTNIVYIGDGFTEADNVVGGLFDREVTRINNFLFTVQPFSTYSEYFSVYKVYAESQNRGARTYPNDSHSTAFNSTYNWMGTERLLVAQNHNALRNYVHLAVTEPHIIVLLVNDNRYGGSGGQIAVISLDSSSIETAIHEIGHVFGLADEYVDEQFRLVAGYTLQHAAQKPNVDITNDRNRVKWSHYIDRPGYNDRAWEGGFYFARRVWRPTEFSIMRNLSVMEFNAISRETIARKIVENARETFTLADFFARDNPPRSLRSLSFRSSNSPMPIPLQVYADSIYGNQQIRANFFGER